jgi:hypothetical protein
MGDRLCDQSFTARGPPRHNPRFTLSTSPICDVNSRTADRGPTACVNAERVSARPYDVTVTVTVGPGTVIVIGGA